MKEKKTFQKTMMKIIDKNIGTVPFVELDKVSKETGISTYKIRKELERIVKYGIKQINPPRGPWIIYSQLHTDRDEFIKYLSKNCDSLIIKRDVNPHSSEIQTEIHVDFRVIYDIDYGIDIQINEEWIPPFLTIKITVGFTPDSENPFEDFRSQYTFHGVGIDFEDAKNAVQKELDKAKAIFEREHLQMNEDDVNEFEELEYIDESLALQAIRQIISNATKEILIMSPFLSNPNICDLLENKRAQSAGVAIKLITGINGNQTQRNSTQKIIQRLETLGVEVRLNTKNQNIHDKLYLNEREVVLGSFNASVSGFGSNSESGIYTSDSNVHKKTRAKFFKNWNQLK